MYQIKHIRNTEVWITINCSHFTLPMNTVALMSQIQSAFVFRDKSSCTRSYNECPFFSRFQFIAWLWRCYPIPRVDCIFLFQHSLCYIHDNSDKIFVEMICVCVSHYVSSYSKWFERDMHVFRSLMWLFLVNGRINNHARNISLRTHSRPIECDANLAKATREFRPVGPRCKSTCIHTCTFMHNEEGPFTW